MFWKHLDNVGFVELLGWCVSQGHNAPYETITQAAELSTVFAVPSLN